MMFKRTEVNGNCWAISGVGGSIPPSATMERYQVDTIKFFYLLYLNGEAQTLNAPNPLSAWLYLRQSISFVCCWCVRGGDTLTRYFGQFENCSNGLQTVRGLSEVGVAVSRGLYGVSVRQAFGDFLTGEKA